MRAKAIRDVGALHDPQDHGLAESNLFREAIDAARGIRSPHDRAEALLEWAKVLFERDQAEARLVLQECLELALSIEDRQDVVAPRAERILCDIASVFSRFDQVRAVALRSEILRRAHLLSRFTGDYILSDLAESFVTTGQFQEALDVTDSVESRIVQEHLILAIAVGMARQGDSRADLFFDQAIQAHLEDLTRARHEVEGETFELSTGQISTSLCHTVQALAQNNRIQKARVTIAHIPDVERRALAESYLAQALSGVGQFQEAIEAAQQIENDYWRISALRQVCSDLAKARDSRATALFITYRKLELSNRNSIGAITLLELVKVLATNGAFHSAGLLATRIEPPRIRVAAECAIIQHSQHVSPTDKHSDKHSRLDIAEREIAKIPDASDRVEALCELGATLFPADQVKAATLLKEAGSVACTIQDLNRVKTAKALRHVAVTMIATSDPSADRMVEEARGVAEKVSGYTDWAEELSQHAELLARRGDQRAERLFGLIAARVPSMDHDFSRNRSMSILAGALARAGNQQRAVELAASISDQEEKSGAYLEIVRALTAVQQNDQAAKIAGIIDSDWKRAEALTVVSSALASAGKAEANAFFKEAISAVESIEDPGRRPHPRKILADTLAAAGRFSDALSILGPRDLNEFVWILAQWNVAFDRLEPELSTKLLREVLRISGWISAQFEEIEGVFARGIRGQT